MHKNSIKEHFESFINDPGIQLGHNDKENILLDDLFIFPDLIDRREFEFHKTRRSFNAAISIKRIARQILAKHKK